MPCIKGNPHEKEVKDKITKSQAQHLVVVNLMDYKI